MQGGTQYESLPAERETAMNKSKPSSTSGVISSFRKRQQQGPVLIYIAAAVLILAGLIFLIVWLSGPSQPLSGLFATDTPTPTVTFTPTNTFTPTETPTITLTPSLTPTFTPSAPFTYIVQEGDSLALIAEKFELGDNGIPLMLALNPSVQENNGIIFPGQEILIPNPGMELPTATPIPPDLPRGTKLKYTVLPGDTLAGIASKFNSTEDAIAELNDIEDRNALQVGDVLIIPVNLVTPTATRLPTSTPLTPAATDTPTPTPTP